MSPESQQPNPGNTSEEVAFVQRALADADKSERTSRITRGRMLAILRHRRVIYMRCIFSRRILSAASCTRFFASTSFFLSSRLIHYTLRQVMNTANTRTPLQPLTTLPAHADFVSRRSGRTAGLPGKPLGFRRWSNSHR